MNDAPPAEPRPAAIESTPPAAPRPAPPVERESDEAGVRRALRVYEQAIENKDLALFRTVRPDLSQDEEKRLRASFQQVERQHVELRVEGVTVTGDRADVRVSREDTIQSGGRAQTSRSTQTIRMARRGDAWIIVSLGR
ncbi:MAG: hypothetical protein NW201_11990 [Gemmatimonadales bacterium]|nr:hypothetical protein [Gemmatimonadales bacterium]